jgi:DNA-binding PadR family transcriptional regulator
VAASATPLILSILIGGDSYGYAIIQQISVLSGGRMAWADGMLYPILHRLEKKGLIESYEGKAEGRRRKYYRILAAGRAELEAQRRNWASVQEMLETIEQTGGEICST